MTISGKAAVIAALLVTSGCAAAGTAVSTIDKADVAWMLVATTLVLFMTIPGIALFYGGMSRKKNVLSVLAQTTVICCALTLVWFAVGYSLAFSPGNAFVGGLDHVFLRGMDIKSTTGQHSYVSLCHLSDDVCRAHGCAHDRIFCRSHEIFGHAGLYVAVVGFCLFPDLSLGVGRRRFLF